MADSQPSIFPSEEWRPVPGYEGNYRVSNLGRVESLPRVIVRKNGAPQTIPGKMKKSVIANNGYPVVSLSQGGKLKAVLVHRLVLAAFVGPAPEGHECRHLDGDKTNYALANLRWGTSSENSFDIVRHGNHFLAKKTHCIRGHALEGANLRSPLSGTKWRGCRSCHNARSHARYHGLPEGLIEGISDQYYLKYSEETKWAR